MHGLWCLGHPAVLGDTEDRWHSRFQRENRSWDKLQCCHPGYIQPSPVTETVLTHTCILPQSLEHTNQLYGCDLYRTTAQERCTLSSPTPSSPQPAVNDGRSSGETPRLLWWILSTWPFCSCETIQQNSQMQRNCFAIWHLFQLGWGWPEQATLSAETNWSGKNNAQVQHNYRRGTGPPLLSHLRDCRPAAAWGHSSLLPLPLHLCALWSGSCSASCLQLLGTQRCCLGPQQGSGLHTLASAAAGQALRHGPESSICCPAHDSAPTASLLPALLLGTWCQPHGMGTVSAAPAESCACGGGPVPGLVCLQCSLGAQAVVSMQDHWSQCPQHWCLLHVPCNVVWGPMVVALASASHTCSIVYLQCHQGQRRGISACCSRVRSTFGVPMPAPSMPGTAQAQALLLLWHEPPDMCLKHFLGLLPMHCSLQMHLALCRINAVYTKRQGLQILRFSAFWQ